MCLCELRLRSSQVGGENKSCKKEYIYIYIQIIYWSPYIQVVSSQKVKNASEVCNIFNSVPLILDHFKS